MNFERRDFLRAGTLGLSGTMFNFGKVFAQDGQSASKTPHPREDPKAVDFKGGTGSLSLRLKFTSGIVDVEVENFSRAEDKTFIMDGNFAAAKDPTTKTRLYRSYFCVDDANQIFARLGDGQDFTSVFVSRTTKSDIYSLTVWNGANPAESFLIDKVKFGDGKASPAEFVVEGKSEKLKPLLLGARKPPDISAEELANALDNLPDYLAFTRGKTLTRRHASPMEFGCLLIELLVPGGLMYLVDWEGIF